MKVSPKEEGELNRSPIQEESKNNSDNTLSLSEDEGEDTDTLNIKPPQLQTKQRGKHHKKLDFREKPHRSTSRGQREVERYYISSKDAARGRYLKDHLSSKENHRAVQYIDKYKDTLHSSRHSHSHRKKHRSVRDIEHHRKHRYRDDVDYNRPVQYFEDERVSSHDVYKHASSRTDKRKRHKEHRYHREHRKMKETENFESPIEAIEVEDDSSEEVDTCEAANDILSIPSDLTEEDVEEWRTYKNKSPVPEQRENSVTERKRRHAETRSIDNTQDEEDEEEESDVLNISDQSDTINNDNDGDDDNSHYSNTGEDDSDDSDSERDSIHSTNQSRNPSRTNSPVKSPDDNSLLNNLTLSNTENVDNNNASAIEPVVLEVTAEQAKKRKIDESLPPYYPAIQGCRSVEEFQCLNHIEEGTYGVVFRAKDKRDDEIVALKRLKMEREKEGFPITSLREINTLLKGQHPNIVTVREIVVGSNMDKIFIVMDYIEHDLKSLMEIMKHKKQRFTIGEVKCLMRQLLCAIAFLHDNWILHRDLKPSNLLLSHKGILKVGDFGLAREYGSPLRAYTPIVVTLWYRAPELLLCTKMYSTPIDVWSVGCIFAELLLMNPLFPGKSEVEQINRIFRLFGTPDEETWPDYKELPAVKKIKFTDYPIPSNLRSRFRMLTQQGYLLLLKLLTYDPLKRITAEDALQHFYFNETPLPIDPSMFPTWPAKSELGKRRALAASPKPPSGGREFKQLVGNDDGFHIGLSEAENRGLPGGGGFSLKF